MNPELIPQQESFSNFTSQLEQAVFGFSRSVIREAPRTIDIQDKNTTDRFIKMGDTKGLRFNIEKRVATAAMKPVPYWENVSASEKALKAQEQFIHNKADRGEPSEAEYNKVRGWLMTRFSLWSEKYEAELRSKRSMDPVSDFLRSGAPDSRSIRSQILAHSIGAVAGGVSGAMRLAFRVVSLVARKQFAENGAKPSTEFLREVARNSFALGIQIATMHSNTQIVFEHLLSKSPPENTGDLDTRIDAWDPELFVLRDNKLSFNAAKILEKAQRLDKSMFQKLADNTKPDAITIGCPGMHVIKPVYDFALDKMSDEYFDKITALPASQSPSST